MPVSVAEFSSLYFLSLLIIFFVLGGLGDQGYSMYCTVGKERGTFLVETPRQAC